MIVPAGQVVVVNLTRFTPEWRGRTLPPGEPVLMDRAEWDRFNLYDLPDFYAGPVVKVYPAGTEAPG